MAAKFYRCNHCGNLVGMIHASGAPIICCGDPMEALEPNTTEAAGEKHLPVIHVMGDHVTVEVGAVAHPMLPEHYIQWIELVTEAGALRKYLKPGEKPEATFATDATAVTAREYCNLHALWKAEK